MIISEKHTACSMRNPTTTHASNTTKEAKIEIDQGRVVIQPATLTNNNYNNK
jgi:hypothetical protein